MKVPPISVVTVVKNSLPLLRQTIENLNTQSTQEFEYIIVDGASTDDTRDYVLSQPKPSSKVISEPDGGIFSAMNKGAAMCSGNYVQFLNAGDKFLSPTTLEEALPWLDGQADIVIFGYSMNGTSYEPEISFRGLIGGMPCHQAIFYKRSSLLERPFNLEMRLCADYHHLLDSLFHKKISIASPIAVDYDTNGISSNPKMARRIRIERARSALKAHIPFSWKISISLYNLVRAAL